MDSDRKQRLEQLKKVNKIFNETIPYYTVGMVNVLIN